MKSFLFFLFISSQVWSQVGAPNSLDLELETYKQQLKDQEVRTRNEKAKLSDARKRLQNFSGDTASKEFLEQAVATSESNVQFAIRGEEELKVLMKMNAEKRELASYSNFINCNAQTPEINLEKETPFSGATFKGAFHNVPRDNQDGLGTCFANTAKNLLVGLSNGKEIASFTDMAVQVQGQQKILLDGLDGGNSCETLKKIEEVGYCPQDFSPMENGERNFFTESLFHHEPLTDLSENIDLLKNFLRNVEKFKFVADANDTKTLEQARIIIEKVKASPNVDVPLPVVRIEIPRSSELYRIHAEKKLSMPFEDFLSEYRASYKKFYPVMIKSILEGKNSKAIFEQYKTNLNGFIQKYNLKGELSNFKKEFLFFADKDFDKPQFLTNFKKSLELMKEISGQSNLSNEAFADFCGESGSGMVSFLNTLTPIVNKLQSSDMNADVLFTEDGKFKSPRELMQLVVAPKCLSSSNRKALGSKLYCQDSPYAITALKQSNKTPEEKVKALREKVVMSLVQGLPLGNTYPVTSSVSHINTIVGLRFNPARKQCEYLIRESQTGTSSWLPEQQIFNKISSLTEVRRR